jgi:hypothetical protein
VNLDAEWSFEWDFVLPPGGTYLISKDKNIRPGPHIPEPSGMALAAVAAAVALVSLGKRVTAPEGIANRE